MIPALDIVAWGNTVPWAEQRQVEQDLIISRAIVAIFSDTTLSRELRFRGGTALNKLHFAAPLRYSEDIDLVRTSAGPIGPILDGVRSALEPWLGRANFDQSPVAPKLRFRAEAEAGGPPIRLKIEINTREIDAFDPPIVLPFRVNNPWFAGAAEVPTFSREEILATKLRALLQREKGRDLFDLDHALDSFDDLAVPRLVTIFSAYLSGQDQTVSRAQAQERMFAKLANPRFLTDMRPLLAFSQAVLLTEDRAKAAFVNVFTRIVDKIPGEHWLRF
ncbi:MAG: nucleotidyl transferase AbiEii/AbiGii toxin family protein, partial [Beijerinckiaceae bacterium]